MFYRYTGFIPASPFSIHNKLCSAITAFAYPISPLLLPVEAIKSFDETTAINIISNTFTDFKNQVVANANYCTFNPLDKVVELYKRLIKEKEAMIEKLEKLVQK